MIILSISKNGLFILHKFRVQKAIYWCFKTKRISLLEQGCANFFNSGPNSNKHNIVRAARLDKIMFYQLLILPGIVIKPYFAKLLYVV